MKLAISLLLLGMIVELQYAQEYDILILGAGSSGLSAAITLHQNNVTNFAILEANDYTGGRMRNVKFHNASVPIGAAWIHEVSVENPLWQLKGKHGLKTKEDVATKILRDTTGGDKTVQFYESEAVYDELTGYINVAMNERIMIEGKSDMDMAAALRYVGWRWESNVEPVVEMYKGQIGPATELAQQSGYWQTKNKTKPTPQIISYDQFIVDDRGYSYAILQEASPILNKIKHKKVVSVIEKHGKNNYTVHDKDGNEYNAKYVLVTFSTGVLTNRKVTFKPDLPPWKYEALAYTPMGHFCKFFLYFNKTFWDPTNFFFVATDQPYLYSAYQNSENFFNKKIITAILIGELCKASHLKSDSVIMNEIYYVLKKVYPNATRPVDMVRNSWSSNEYFYGAYSTRLAGITESDINNLMKPVDDGLWFAGEYNDGEHYGYCHAAYASGKKQALDIVNCMKYHTKCPSYVARTTTTTTTATTTTTTTAPPPCSSATSVAQQLAIVSFITYLGYIIV